MILGINTSHDAAFCLLDRNGHPAFLAEEERFNRTKHTGFSTLLALDAALKSQLLDPLEVTDLVYSFEMEEPTVSRLMDKCLENVCNSYGADVLTRVTPYFHQPSTRFSAISGLGQTVGFNHVRARLSMMFPRAKESSLQHHLCHAASAFYPSPFSSAAVVVMDGSGRLETTTVWRADSSGIDLIRQTELPHSLGVLYWLASQYIGLEEGQAMGLAAYGRPAYKNIIYERLVDLKENGEFRFRAPIVSWFDMDSEYALEVISGVFGRPLRQDGEDLTQFHADVAASIQAVTEDAFIRIAKFAKQITGNRNLCIAGGVVQNCIANGRLLRDRAFENLWIQPVAHDAGTALGAALHYYYKFCGTIPEPRWRMTDARLGIGIQDGEIETCLNAVGLKFRRSSNVAEEAAAYISQGKIIGWFQGRPEAGPRALGARSILADARSGFNSFALNKIKQREAWRPFAPSALECESSEYFGDACESPYMILSFPVKEAVRQTVPTIAHVNGLARVQTVSSPRNGNYYDLVSTFKNLTGCPLLLNTSFNLRAEPIVQHPLEAVRDYLVTTIDALFMEDLVVDEKPPLDSALRIALAECKYIGLYYTVLLGKSSVGILTHSNRSPAKAGAIAKFIRILEWLGIGYCEIRLTDSSEDYLEELAKKCQESIYLISSDHLRDESAIQGLPSRIRNRTNIGVLDAQMFLSETSASDFLRIIAENRKRLRSLARGKRLIVWCSNAGEITEIIDDLGCFGVQVHGIVLHGDATAPLNSGNLEKVHPEFLRSGPRRVLLIVSSSVMEVNKSRLRKMGYHSGKGYLVWELFG